MSKVLFDIKYRPQIESGEYKVETRDGKPVRIICFDAPIEHYPIIGVSDNPKDDPYTFTEEGKYIYGDNQPDSSDLFIVTPEELLTEFEKAFDNLAELYHSDENPDDVACCKEYASELLALAREQFIKDGYVIEKKAFHDAVEKIDPEVMKEVSENIDLENFIHNLGERYPEVSFAKLTRIAKAAYDYGKAEALKDMPRWRKFEPSIDAPNSELEISKELAYSVMRVDNMGCIWLLKREELIKLPEFKEGSHE